MRDNVVARFSEIESFIRIIIPAHVISEKREAPPFKMKNSDTFTATTYLYDEIGHLTSLTDAENHITTFSYTSIFGLTRTTYPDSTYEECEYDNVGNVISFTDASGNDTVLTLDDAYRLARIEYEDQSTVSFTYDLSGNTIKMEDDAPNIGDYVEYTYDSWNRLVTETRYISTDTYTVSYQYDVASRLTKLTYPDGMEILYSYSDLNRMTGIKRYVDGSNDEVLMENVQYDAESLLIQFDYGNNLRATASYDSRDRLLTIDVKNGDISFLDIDYTYDNNGNITQLLNGWRDVNSNWHSQTESYCYDGLDRLTSASCTSWSHTYSFDKVGNRTAKDSVTYTINVVNEVIALDDGTSFTYDDNGNRTQKTKGSDNWTYSYDYANRLTKIEKNDTTLGEYVYDGNGRRIRATEEGVTTTYICSGMNTLYEETMSGSAAYIYGPTGKLAKRTTINEESHIFYYHADRLGSTRLVTDENKDIVSAITYQPFGGKYSEEGSEKQLYAGKEGDFSGLYYYGARYYDPEIGRFITRDQKWGRIGNPQELNRYTYCINNPIKYIDPDGQDYFNPAWAKEWYVEDTPLSNPESLSTSFALELQKLIVSLKSGLGEEIRENRLKYGAIAGLLIFCVEVFLSSMKVNPYVGSLIGLLACFFILFCYEDAEFCNDLWENDLEYRGLLETAEHYQQLFEQGYDCKEELDIAMIDLNVYMLQAKYGENWKSYAPAWLVRAYLWLLEKREKEESSKSNGGTSGGSGYIPPPGSIPS